jgi:twinkle protein
MKIISLNTKLIYDIDFSKAGENTLKCPECSGNRKKKSAKPFRWNNDKLVGHCYHCDTSFVEYKPYKSEKIYTAPEWKNKTDLTDKAVKFFTSRMISQATLNKMRVYSDKNFMPQLNKEAEVICFPYFFNEKLINIKYRGPKKSFTQVSGSELIFWNLDIVTKSNEIIIVEGEMDLLSLIEIGIENVLSVPNGASGKELTYINDYIELFEGKKIIVAVDNDLKGSELKAELIRRFGSENCLLVNFEDCKDANEVLCEKGGIELKRIISEAKEIPVSGIIDLASQYDEIYNLYLNGLQPGNKLGIPELDAMITWELSRLAIWTGIPSHGKSSIVDWVNVLLNIHYGWKVAYFSPESYPVKYHFARLYTLISGHKFKDFEKYKNEYESIFNYIEDNFYFIYPEDNFKVETIIEKANYLVKKKGINILTIDPWNNLEHTKNRGESDTEYTGRVLYELTKFGKKNNCLIQLVAHPTKMKKTASGLFEKPTMYDINGSANFYNRCDYGISIYRYFDEKDPRIDFDVLKVKWNHLGEGGSAQMRYNYNNGRLEGMDKTIDYWNNSNYLLPKQEEIKQSFYEVEKDEDFFNRIEPNANFEQETPF